MSDPAVWIRVQTATEQRIGNAISLGHGRFLTAEHVLGNAEFVAVSSSADSCDVIAIRLREPLLTGRDLCLLEAEDAPFAVQQSVSLTGLDRWERLTLKGWLLTRDAAGHPRRDFREFSGSVLGRATPGGLTVPLWDLQLDPPAGGSVRSMSGCGVFNSAGYLVGILSHEHEEARGEIVSFASLEGWPSLWAGRAPVACWEEDVPEPWRDGWTRHIRAQHPHLFGMSPVLDSLLSALEHAPHGNGYVVLLGGPRRGKSAIMAELVRRAGPDQCLWQFASRGQSDLLHEEDKLIRQLAYLLNRSKNEIPRARHGAPGAVLGELLCEWARTGKSLLVVLDALDELDGGEAIPIPVPLPDGVFVIASTRPQPRLLAEITRRRPFLGVVDLDGGGPVGLRCLLPPEQVREASQEAISRVWADWQARDGCCALPEELLRAIHQNFGRLVGFHAAYAEILRSRSLQGDPLPSPQEVPSDPDQVNSQFWDWLSDRSQTGEHRLALGLIAAARVPLSLRVLRALCGWQSAELDRRFLSIAGPILTISDDRVSAHHASWNELVRERLAGREWVRCQQLLANGTPDWPMQELDAVYWLCHRPHHLMEIVRDPNAPPAVREQTQIAWMDQMGDPIYLADRGAHDGIDSLLAELNEGVREQFPDGEWRNYWIILSREVYSLRAAVRAV